LKKLFFLCILLSQVMFASNKEYITKAELTKILKDYIRIDEVDIYKKLQENTNRKLRKEIYEQINNASNTQILKKITYLKHIKKYKEAAIRCDFLNKRGITEKKSIFLKKCSEIYENNLEIQKSIKLQNELLHLEKKEISNEEILKKLLELYQKTNNINKIKEIKDLLNY